MLHNQQDNLTGVDSVTVSNKAIYSTGDRPVVVAKADSLSGFLTVRRRSHGTYFERSLHVAELADLLDPEGTTVRRVS